MKVVAVCGLDSEKLSLLMEPSHPLKALLQLQLGSDSYAVLHLPYVLDSLTYECFLPSSHLSKWTTRINSLLSSKDNASRWAGLCLSYKTSLVSKATMIEYSQSWLGVALRILSKNEPVPIIKIAVRLIRHIFFGATDVPEFQRQVVTPNVPKFTLALMSLVENNVDLELTILVLTTLARLVPSYPTLHRVQHVALSALSLKFLSGTAPQRTSPSLSEAASRLYSVLHFTGGKVGSTSLWRKSVDETLTFAWSAFRGLRSTFPNEGYPFAPARAMLSTDPLVTFPLNFDCLRCSILILRDLLGSVTHRPVQVPIGALINLTGTLLSCTPDDKIEGHTDSAVRAMEISIIPSIWEFGCDLAVSLAKCTRHHLTPKLTRLVSYIAFHLESPLSSSHRLPFVRALQSMLTYAHPLQLPLLTTRLTKALLPSLGAILATQSETQPSNDSASKAKKGKKRVRGYEGDEVFKVSREVICPTVEDGKVVLTTLDVIRLILQNPYLAPAVHSLSSRILLSVLLVLPQIPPASFSPNLTLHGQVLGKVQTLCTELVAGTTSAMSRSLGLVVGSVAMDGTEQTLLSCTLAQHEFDLLLHPRMPPLVRSLPHVESLSLFRAEESQDEIAARESLALGVVSQDTSSIRPAEMQDKNMEPQSPPLRPTQHSTKLLATAVTPRINTQPPPPTYQGKPAVKSPTLISSPFLKTLSVPQPQSQQALHDDDEDDEIPAINMDSDSD